MPTWTRCRESCPQPSLCRSLSILSRDSVLGGFHSAQVPTTRFRLFSDLYLNSYTTEEVASYSCIVYFTQYLFACYSGPSAPNWQALRGRRRRRRVEVDWAASWSEVTGLPFGDPEQVPRPLRPGTASSMTQHCVTSDPAPSPPRRQRDTLLSSPQHKYYCCDNGSRLEAPPGVYVGTNRVLCLTRLLGASVSRNCACNGTSAVWMTADTCWH